ncbi:MAG: ABC transporter permease subunit, partial [Clostridia bacterium]|nr:ABC transporter permease subunit [Clostridia bacterium]
MVETWEYFLIILPALMRGLKVSLLIFFCTIVMAIPLGLPFALGSINKFPPIKWLCRLYVLVFRGTPLMLQLFFFYFFLPISFGIRLDDIETAVLTYVLNYAAYFAEIYRGGIESIDKGQCE